MYKRRSATLLNKFKAVVLGVGFFVGLVGIVSALAVMAPQHKVSADASNDIINGGFSTPQGFITSVRNNNSGSGHHDLQAIYAYKDFGLTAGMYDNFAKNAKWGTTCTDNNLYDANGKVVGTNASSIGRNQAYQHGGYTLNIAGNQYYGNANSQNFGAGTRCLTVAILYDGNGQAVFAVMKDCGNPMKFTPKSPPPAPKPAYSCVALNFDEDKDVPQRYTFSSQATATNGASIAYVVYKFGDGSTEQRNSPSTVVTHSFAEGGSQQVTVTVHVLLPGGKPDVIQPAGKCVRQLNVPKPNYACVQLKPSLVDLGTNSWKLTVTDSYGNGVTPVSADFNFGDGKTQNGVKLTGKQVSVNHSYPAMNKVYSAVAVVHFLAYGKSVSATSSNCRVPVPVTVPYCQGLSGRIIDANKYEAQFTATAVLNGRTLSSADFNFGDGTVQNGVKATTNKTVVVTHPYATGGNYNALATLHFVADGHSYTAPTCRALVTPKTIVSECKPNVPMGDVRCEVCTYDSSLPADSPDCKQPCTASEATTIGDNTCETGSLPNTGAGNTIAIFSAVVVGGFLVYRQIIYRRHKAAFLAAERGDSLPLTDPINNNNDPVRAMAEQPSRSAFRRRRQF